MIKAKAVKMAEAIEYRKGSIVSSEIIRKDSGTVTVFAFDKGEALSEHVAPYDALVYVLDGQARISICGRPHILSKGEMIIMPAHKPHALKAVKKFKMLLAMIRS